MTAVVFLDTETTGLDPQADHIWEIAAIRVEPGHRTETWQFTVDHAPPSAEYLDSRFAAGYLARYSPHRAVIRSIAAHNIDRIFRGRAHMVGAVPSFDAERLGVMLRLAGVTAEYPWHYHLIDVEALAVGYLRGRGQPLDLPWDSNALSRAVGVDPARFARHTAMGDVEWAKAIYDAVTA